MQQVYNTGCYSKAVGKLPAGCALCVRGRKLVLFITGLCGKSCYYCPVSPHKMRQDVIYANERKVTGFNDILEEAEITNAYGAGITGGDPLVRVQRCAEFIEKLKDKFGKSFHIHLYTPLLLVNEERMKILADAGLDEIRLHPDLEKPSEWEKISLAKHHGWKVGIEIPVIPGKEKETKSLMDFAKGKIDFMTLNELEFSDANDVELSKRGFGTMNRISYGVKGSAELGARLLRYASKIGLKAHFCTAKLKDAVQMTNRIKLRQKNVALPFDIQTTDGTLVRGAVYLPETKPGFGYRRQLELVNEKTCEKLQITFQKLRQALNLRKDEAVLDLRKARIIVSPEIIEEKAEVLKSMKLVPAVVEEYPTDDALEVDIQFL